jgi:hypothetical protein
LKGLLNVNDDGFILAQIGDFSNTRQPSASISITRHLSSHKSR